MNQDCTNGCQPAIGKFAIPGRTLQVGVVTGALGGLYLIYLIYLERKKS